MVHLKEANNMFWALVLENGKRYSQMVEQSFHISMAALEIPTDPDSTKGKQSQSVSVMIANQKSEFLICSLNTRNITQQPLDLNFNEGEEVTFFVNGPGTVHLTGYQIEDEDMDMLDEMDEDEDEIEDDEVPQLVAAKKRKTDDDEPGSLKKKTKWLTPGGGDFDDDSDDSSEDADFDPLDLIDMEADDDDDDSDEDDDLEDEDDLSDDDDEIEEEQVKKTPQSDKKIQKKQPTPNMNGKKVEQNKKSEQTPKKEKNKSKGQTETPKQEKKQENAASTPGPGGDGDQSAKKKRKKKKKNKNEQNDGSQDENVAKTPQGQQKQQNQTPKQNQTPQQKQQNQTPKQQNQTPKQKQQALTPGKTPQGKTPQGKTPQGKAEQQSKTPKRLVLPGGIFAEDITSGDGPVVKKGKMAHVYYVGKLQKDGRQFDSCTSGKPFRFKLGLGEVIQGWDKGVEGMKVGGKRRLTVPPQQGYGNQRSGPIPPNSTLVFEVELKNIT